MSAYYRRRGEDRVTEVLATALDQSPVFLDALVKRVGLPGAASYDLQTQVTSGNATIDLEIVGRNSTGDIEWVLWSEHKVADPLTTAQLTKEWVALTARAGLSHRRLIAVTLVAPTADAAAFAARVGATFIRWRDVTNAARSALTGLPPSTDAQQATSRDGSMLREWIAFADNELEDAVDPLTPERAILLPEAEKALDTVTHLLVEGFARACTDFGAGRPRESNDELHATPPAESQLGEGGFKLYAKYLPEGGFGDVHGPCLMAGGWIEGDAAVEARRSRDLHVAMGEAGLAAWDEDDRRGGWIEWGLAVALAELAELQSLEAQEDLFADTCRRAFSALEDSL